MLLKGIDMDTITLQIIFWFIPGILSAYLYAKLTGRKKNEKFNFIVESLLLGILSNGITHFLFIFLNDLTKHSRKPLNLQLTLLDDLDRVLINYSELTFIMLVGIVVTLIAVYVKNNNFLHYILINLKLSSYSGYAKVWNLMFTRQTETEWVFIKDFDLNEIILGLPKCVSRELNPGEILLTNVIVSDFDGNEKYTVGTKYIIFNPDKMRIEFESILESENSSEK